MEQPIGIADDLRPWHRSILLATSDPFSNVSLDYQTLAPTYYNTR